MVTTMALVWTVNSTLSWGCNYVMQWNLGWSVATAKNANANSPEAAKLQNSIFLILQMPPLHSAARGGCPLRPSSPFPPPLRSSSHCFHCPPCRRRPSSGPNIKSSSVKVWRDMWLQYVNLRLVLLPMLCLIIKLHHHSTIYFSILSVSHFLQFSLIAYLFIVLYVAVYVLFVLCYLVLWPQHWINTTLFVCLFVSLFVSTL